MQSTAADLDSLIDQYLPRLNALPEADLMRKPSPVQWSKKEIIGHLADSAQNNIRRFVVARYEDTPTITYNQDKWVAFNGYQHRQAGDIIQLWYLLNKQIVSILNNTPQEEAQRSCRSETIHSIEWLAADYIKHLKHHLHQVLDLEPVAYP